MDAACNPSWKARDRAGRMTGNSPFGKLVLHRDRLAQEGLSGGKSGFGSGKAKLRETDHREPEGVIGLGSAEAGFGALRKTRSSGPNLKVTSKEGRLEEVQVRSSGRGNGWGGLWSGNRSGERAGMQL